MKKKMAEIVAEAVEQARAAKAKGFVPGAANAGDTKKVAAKAAADMETKWFSAFSKRDKSALDAVEQEIVAERKAADLTGQDITTAADGGWLVPLTVESSIIKKMNATSEIRKYATVLSNVVGDLKLGAEDVLVQAYWVAEGDTATLSSAAWANVTLRPKKAVGFGKFTDEVLQQTVSNPDIRKLVVDQFAYAIQVLEDAAFTNGDGTGKPKGYRTATLPGANIVSQAAAAMAIGDITKLYRALPRGYRANGTFFANDAFEGLADGLKDTAGRPLLNTFDNDLDKVKGRPVAYDPNLPTNLGTGTNETEVWFGDFSKYVITDGGGIRVDYGTEGDDFKRSKISVRVIHYTDGAVVLPEAFAKLTGVK